MSEIPAINQWTYEKLKAVVEQNDFEPGDFDFKAALTGTGDEYKAILKNSITRGACAMANTRGGHLIFGVGEKGKIDERLCGIPTGDCRKLFDDLLDAIEPKPSFEAVPKLIPHPTEQKKGFFVVHIPQSPNRPHMYENKFYHRSDGGSSEPMRLPEIVGQIVARESESWRKEHTATTMELLPTLVSRMGLSKGPVQSFDWNVDEATFEGVLLEHLRSNDTLPIKWGVEKLPNLLQSREEDSATDDVESLLDHLFQGLAISLRFDENSCFQLFLKSLQQAYQGCSPTTGYAIATRILAIGALTVRLERWRDSATLASLVVQGQGGKKSSLMYDALSKAEKARLFSSKQRFIPIVADSEKLIETRDWLSPGGKSSNNDRKNSLCQFDALRCLKEIDVFPGQGNVPHFAQWYRERTEPVLLRLIEEDSILCTFLKCDLSRLAQLMDVLLTKAENYGSRQFASDWDRRTYGDTKVREFVDKYLPKA